MPTRIVFLLSCRFSLYCSLNVDGQSRVTCAQRGLNVALDPARFSIKHWNWARPDHLSQLRRRLLVVLLHTPYGSLVVHRDMDAATTSCPTSPPGNADAVHAPPHRGRDDPPQSPDRLPVATVAQRRIMKAGAIGSPVRRSPRLSCLPPPQPPMESRDTQDLDESGDDESESVNDVAVQLSRDETPEDDVLPPDGERPTYSRYSY